MRNKFTKQAQNALALAKAAAVDFELGYIGTEHLLLGLLSETEGTAGRVLEEFQVDGKKLVELIDKLVTPVDAGNVEVIAAGLQPKNPEGSGQCRSRGTEYRLREGWNRASASCYAKRDGLCRNQAFVHYGCEHPEALCLCSWCYGL